MMNGLSEVTYDGKSFIIKMVLAGFEPQDIKIKLKHGKLYVNGNRMEQLEHNASHTNTFKSLFVVPADVDLETLRATYHQGNVLVITASKGSKEPSRGSMTEKTIPIQ